MKKTLADKADFKLFLVLWNQRQNMKTPRLHIAMAQWLEQAWESGDTRLLLMAFRSAGKSSIVGIFAAWLIYTNPDIRILVLAADTKLAGKMVRNVKRIIERHPLTIGLKPRSADQWAAFRFTVEREGELRDPSMIAHGVTSNITGSRADIVICDDVEVPNTCDSADKRADLRERLSEIAYVLVAGGAQLYVGTPHSYYSIYADTPRSEIGEETPFLNGFKRLCLPIIDEDGQSAWPERYAQNDIEQIKTDSGPNKFESQMMLRPVNIMDGRLNAQHLQFYSGEVEYCKITDAMYLGSTQMEDVRSWWDPSFASAKGDDSVLAVVFSDAGGNYYLHHLEYLSVNDQDEEDEATQQSKIIASIAKKYMLPMVSVETNGIGKFLPKILEREMKKTNTLAVVRQEVSTKNKAQRILEGFDAVLAAKKLYVHDRIKQTPFVMQLREWKPGSTSRKVRDDALDAVSAAIISHPIRIKTIHGNIRQKRHSWRKGTGVHHAKDDFDV